MTPSVFAPLQRLFLLLVLFLGAAMPALAQTDAPAAEEQTGPQQALAQLVEVLRDDAAREALIAELEASASAVEGAVVEEATTIEDVAREELRSIGALVSEVTRDAVESAAASVAQLWRQLSNTPRIFRR